MSQSRGTLVISLDFELYWGVRDKRTLDDYGANIRGVQQAVPAMLESFKRHGIHATWATVGFLFFGTRTELEAALPSPRPAYTDTTLDPYAHIPSIGANEETDPYHYAPSLIKRILACPGQEIGTHTFSHYYCLEPGQDFSTFRADLEAARAAAATRGITVESLVFPRNQFNEEYLRVCAELGITSYRGNESSWLYRPRNKQQETLARRVCRAADAYVSFSGANTFTLDALGTQRPYNIPSSRFLRPYRAKLAQWEPMRLRRICRDLTHAAHSGEIYHLWWHPHNFGTNLKENMLVLNRVLKHFATLRDSHGMESLTMAELVRRHENAA